MEETGETPSRGVGTGDKRLETGDMSSQGDVGRRETRPAGGDAGRRETNVRRPPTHQIQGRNEHGATAATVDSFTYVQQRHRRVNYVCNAG